MTGTHHDCAFTETESQHGGASTVPVSLHDGASTVHVSLHGCETAGLHDFATTVIIKAPQK